MNIPKDILNKVPDNVAGLFLQWDKIMENDVEFWPLPGDFDVHTKSHCERVLLLALLIGSKRCLTQWQMTALCHASIFHDSRRKDNYMDTGHGDRAAEYYKEYCRQNGMKFMPVAYAAIKFHDRDDKLGEDFIKQEAGRHEDAETSEEQTAAKWTEVYHDFKDADALDRLRLGPWALDVRFLRTEEAKGMVDFAQELVVRTIDPVELKKVMDATRPFARKFSENK